MRPGSGPRTRRPAGPFQRNLLLPCGFHHTLVHEGGWTVEWWGRGSNRRAGSRDPRGQLHVGMPPRPPELGEDGAETALQRNRERGVDPDTFTSGARWEFERDIPDEVWFRATEAALS